MTLQHGSGLGHVYVPSRAVHNATPYAVGEPPCVFLDANIAYLGRGLKRRGAVVYLPYYDYPMNARDEEILWWANHLACPVVSLDTFFKGKPCSIHFPFTWQRRYNTWEQVTKVLKLYREARKTCTEKLVYNPVTRHIYPIKHSWKKITVKPLW